MTLLRRGAHTKRRAIHEIKSLTKDDLAILEQRRDTPVVQKFRDSHHMVARLLATGLRHDLVAEQVGYSRSRVSVLAADPAFKDLIASYRAMVNEDFSKANHDFVALATSNMMKAERMLADKLDAADEMDETLSTRELVAIVGDRADRVGFGKKQTNLNINVDFAAKLEAAIARSGKVLELKPGVGPMGARPIKSLPGPAPTPASPPSVGSSSDTLSEAPRGQVPNPVPTFRRAM